MGKWKSFSMKDRCPICSTYGRKGDAPCGHDGHRIEINCCKALELGIRKGDQIGDYVAIKEVDGVQPGLYFVHKDHLKHDPDAPKKKQRKSQTREWIYYNKQKQPVVKVRRTDSANGKQIYQSRFTSEGHWVSGLGNLTSKDWEILNYHKAISVMEREQWIFIVEGETCVDALNSLGFFAVTNKGGTSGFYPEQWEVLKGYSKLVFVPDMDQPGVTHMKKIQEVTGPGKWIYCYPEVGTWKRLPKAGGVDIVDWIEWIEEEATRGAPWEVILKVIADERLEVTDSANAVQCNLFDPGMTSRKVGGKGFGDPYMPSGELSILLHLEIVEPGLSGSERKGKISDIAKQAGWRNADVRSLLEDLELEHEYRADVKDSREENNELFAAQNRTLDLYSVLPQRLATPIIRAAQAGGLDPMMIFQPLLAGVGTVMSKRVIKITNKFIQSPIVWPISVAGPGSGKSPAAAIGLNALRDREESYRLDYKDAEKQLKILQANWDSKSKDEKAAAIGTNEDPEEFKENNKRRRLMVNGSATPEAVERILGEQPKHSILLQTFDELLKLASMDRYNKDKNTYAETLLELWGGLTLGDIDRVNEKSSRFLNYHSINLYGGVQTNRINQLFDFQHDANGMLGRVLPSLYKRPKNFGILQRSEVNIDELLDGLYGYFLKEHETKGSLLVSRLSSEAEQKFDTYYKQYSDLLAEKEESNPVMSQVYSKMRVHLARLALILHGIECYFDRSKDINIVDGSTIERAAILVSYYIDQIKLIQGLVKRRGNISGTLLKIHNKLQKTGKVTIRDVTNTWRNPKDIQGRMNAKKALILLEELASMGIGCLVGKVLHLNPPENNEGNDKGGGSPPPGPLPSDFPITGIERQVREQIKQAIDVSDSGAVEPVPVLVGAGAQSGNSHQAMGEAPPKVIAIQNEQKAIVDIPSSPPPESPPISTSVAVLDKPPETQQAILGELPEIQQTSGKGFGQPQTEKKAQPNQDDRDHPRFKALEIKGTGKRYLIVQPKSSYGSSYGLTHTVLCTDEYAGLSVSALKVGDSPAVLTRVKVEMKLGEGAKFVKVADSNRHTNKQLVVDEEDGSPLNQTFVNISDCLGFEYRDEVTRKQIESNYRILEQKRAEAEAKAEAEAETETE